MVKFEILSDEERKLIHERSLWLLSTTGIKIDSEKILELMEENGCAVDRKTKMVKFPEQLVEEAVKSCPEKFILGGLDEKNDMFLGEGNTYIATDGQGCFAFDRETGQRRDSTMKDLTEAARICDELDYIKCFWPPVMAHDVKPGTRTIHELIECWKVSSKHFQTDCFNEGQAKYFKKILIEIFGNEDTIKKRKPFSLVCCPVTPLEFEGAMVEGTVSMGEFDVPAVILPMPISGTSAPMSMLSTIIQNNTEVLAGIAILQTAKKGRPIIYGNAPGILDMKTGMFCVGSPEGALQNAAGAEMARLYGLPSLASGGGADGKEPGIQTTIERMTGLLPTMMAQADIVCGVGLTDTAQYLHHEDLIIGEDVVGYCNRIAEGVDANPENDLSDLVAKGGPGTTFLSEISTIKYLKKGEQYYPKVLSRESYEAWSHSDKKNIMEYASAKVDEIMKKPAKNNFDNGLSDRLAKIMKDADAEIGDDA